MDKQITMPKVYLRLANSQKSGNKYPALVVNVGYGEKILSYDKNLISEILHVPVWDLMELPLGNYSVEVK